MKRKTKLFAGLFSLALLFSSLFNVLGTVLKSKEVKEVDAINLGGFNLVSARLNDLEKIWKVGEKVTFNDILVTYNDGTPPNNEKLASEIKSGVIFSFNELPYKYLVADTTNQQTEYELVNVGDNVIDFYSYCTDATISKHITITVNAIEEMIGAEAIAKEFNDAMELNCDSNGNTSAANLANIKTAWDNAATQYNSLGDDEKTKFVDNGDGLLASITFNTASSGVNLSVGAPRPWSSDIFATGYDLLYWVPDQGNLYGTNADSFQIENGDNRAFIDEMTFDFTGHEIQNCLSIIIEYDVDDWGWEPEEDEPYIGINQNTYNIELEKYPQIGTGYQASITFEEAITISDMYFEQCGEPEGDCAKRMIKSIKFYGNSSEPTEEITEMISKYDYIYGKYADSLGLDDFLNRKPAKFSLNKVNPIVDKKVATETAFITTLTLVSVLAVGGYFFYRSRKEQHN